MLTCTIPMQVITIARH